jgi:hypothetical protein
MTVCEHVRAPPGGQSPFAELIITGFYDGATEGLTRCQHCGRAYAFSKLAWDHQQDVRVYGLVVLERPLEVIRSEVLGIGQGEVGALLVQALAPNAEQALASLFDGSIQYVLAAEDLRSCILAGKAVDGDIPRDRDWFAWIGL